jgi:hypothetical protein
MVIVVRGHRRWTPDSFYSSFDFVYSRFVIVLSSFRFRVFSFCHLIFGWISGQIAASLPVDQRLDVCCVHTIYRFFRTEAHIERYIRV